MHQNFAYSLGTSLIERRNSTSKAQPYDVVERTASYII